MRLRDEQAVELRLWATERLERLTETDPKILADYAVQLLHSHINIEHTRNCVIAGLQEFLLEDTTHFVAELLHKATSLSQSPKLVRSAPTAIKSITRDLMSTTQVQPPQHNEMSLSNACFASRKRKHNQTHAYEKYAHRICKPRVNKRGRGGGDVGGGINRENRGDQRRSRCRGRIQDVSNATDSHIQPIGLGTEIASFNLPNMPTPPPGMPDFAVLFVCMAAMMSTQERTAKEGNCSYFDAHGYCMGGDACLYEHRKQAPNIEAQQKIKRYVSEREHADEAYRMKAPGNAVGYLGKNQAICRFFPNCTNRTCTFKHTANFPASIAPCKFFPNCTNRICPFKHVPARPTPEVLCRFFPNCNKDDCTFTHRGSGTTSNLQS